MSWLDVGLAVLNRTGWRKECSTPMRTNSEKVLPPVMQEARFYVESSLDAQPCYRNVNGAEVLTAQAPIMAGLVQIDDVASTLVCPLLDGNPRVCHGAVRGRLLGPESPAYINEVALRHGVAVLKEGMSAVDQRLIQHVTMRVGNGKPRYLIKKWLTTGEYILAPTAARDIVDDLHRLCDWSRANVVMRPLSSRKLRFAGERRPPYPAFDVCG